MIEKKNSRQSYRDKQKILNELPDNPTANDVLDHLLGNKDNWNMSEYVLHRYDHKNKQTFANRLNLLWFYPVFILTIPFQYLILGQIGVSRNSKIGKVINWLTGILN